MGYYFLRLLFSTVWLESDEAEIGDVARIVQI